jgi:hypothetical protein
MPRASSAPQHPPRSRVAQRVARGFPADQWHTLMRLPAEVMIAVIATLPPDHRRTVPVGLAGLDAIAAGRSYDSNLVRAVVAAIYAEPEDPDAGGSTDAAHQREQVLVACRQAMTTLRQYADPGDAAVYRHWVQQVAVRVSAAAYPGGETVPALQQEFLAALGDVLR